MKQQMAKHCQKSLDAILQKERESDYENTPDIQKVIEMMILTPLPLLLKPNLPTLQMNFLWDPYLKMHEGISRIQKIWKLWHESDCNLLIHWIPQELLRDILYFFVEYHIDFQVYLENLHTVFFPDM